MEVRNILILATTCIAAGAACGTSRGSFDTGTQSASDGGAGIDGGGDATVGGIDAGSFGGLGPSGDSGADSGQAASGCAAGCMGGQPVHPYEQRRKQLRRLR
jgi:hypothetical protein